MLTSDELYEPLVTLTTEGVFGNGTEQVDIRNSKHPVVKAFWDDVELQEMTICSTNFGIIQTFQKAYKRRTQERLRKLEGEFVDNQFWSDKQSDRITELEKELAKAERNRDFQERTKEGLGEENNQRIVQIIEANRRVAELEKEKAERVTQIDNLLDERVDLLYEIAELKQEVSRLSEADTEWAHGARLTKAENERLTAALRREKYLHQGTADTLREHVDKLALHERTVALDQLEDWYGVYDSDGQLEAILNTEFNAAVYVGDYAKFYTVKPIKLQLPEQKEKPKFTHYGVYNLIGQYLARDNETEDEAIRRASKWDGDAYMPVRIEVYPIPTETENK